MNFKTSTLATLNEERVYEGLRIPPTLDTVTSINFVLTQEPGKLKPKDLKAAIERNRAEREQRAEEQKRLRDEGGGAGLLDLRGILAEERLNSNEGDPFQRQLREMAFLADVEEVEKLEIEKGFRVSEDYLGSNILGQDDINIVYKQRRIAALHKKRSDWRSTQERNHTGLFPPTHAHVKAGASAEIAQQLLKTLAPHFDMNRNDIWSKRMNTLRRFISLVSRWIIRKRVRERIGKVMDMFAHHGAASREEVKALIDLLHLKKSKPKETKPTTAAAATAGAGAGGVPSVSMRDFDFDDGTDPAAAAAAAAGSSTSWDKDRPASVGVMVFSNPNDALLQRENNQVIIDAEEEKVASGGAEVTTDMARRVLFPQCNPEHGGSAHRTEILTHDPRAPIQFDDRTFFQLKVKPEYLTLGYTALPYAAAPVYFPPSLEKSLRIGAPEEYALRPPADANVTANDIEAWLPEPLASQPTELTALGALPPDSSEAEKDAAAPANITEESNAAAAGGSMNEVISFGPRWLVGPSEIAATVSTARMLCNSNNSSSSSSSSWSKSEVNFFDDESKYRVFGVAGPRRSDLDSDWCLRPDSESLLYEQDASLRNRWQSKPGFATTNIYLLGNYESRNNDPPPPPGPMLSTDFYQLDCDRHASGLSCFTKDHLRGTSEWDPEVAPLQLRQDKADYLTDSESDEEEENDDPEHLKLIRPSMEKVRNILRPPKTTPDNSAAAAAAGGKNAKGKPAAKGAAAAAASPAPPLTNDTVGSEGFGLAEGDSVSHNLTEGQRKEEQVELLRDRKTLDLESTILKARVQKIDSVTKRLCEIAESSQCLLQALPVQLPFHSYEDEVYKIMEPRMPALNNHHVEFNARQSFESLPHGNSSAALFSPTAGGDTA